jgi:hypothetical protein
MARFAVGCINKGELGVSRRNDDRVAIRSRRGPHTLFTFENRNIFCTHLISSHPISFLPSSLRTHGSFRILFRAFVRGQPTTLSPDQAKKLHDSGLELKYRVTRHLGVNGPKLDYHIFRFAVHIKGQSFQKRDKWQLEKCEELAKAYPKVYQNL